ncbi:hypothetical protein EJ04DRAFT_566096 [Polyplosphaeria fusca]|uniref:DNA-directed RNA polymerase III subunit RPC9 n=1 Tax=Polyplosphaeria fusca TaxID=682080 RepID=A0A9P4V0R1_9PLEO|nr:hypothetical protein EJ04DRAFT_566096 [Polyplosphaeria fusca]
MKIKQAQSAILTNHEVLLHLRSVEAEYSGTDGRNNARPIPPNLKLMLKDSTEYLESTQTHHLADAHPSRPDTLYRGTHSLLQALAHKYRLNKTEYLQMYNLRPTNLVTLGMVIEEAGLRFTEDEMQDMLDMIREVFERGEGDVPEGAEDAAVERVPRKMKGITRKKKNGK